MFSLKNNVIVQGHFSWTSFGFPFVGLLSVATAAAAAAAIMAIMAIMAMTKRCECARQVSRNICSVTKKFLKTFTLRDLDLYKVFWARSGLKMDYFSRWFNMLTMLTSRNVFFKYMFDMFVIFWYIFLIRVPRLLN